MAQLSDDEAMSQALGTATVVFAEPDAELVREVLHPHLERTTPKAHAATQKGTYKDQEKTVPWQGRHAIEQVPTNACSGM